MENARKIEDHPLLGKRWSKKTPLMKKVEKITIDDQQIQIEEKDSTLSGSGTLRPLPL